MDFAWVVASKRYILAELLSKSACSTQPEFDGFNERHHGHQWIGMALMEKTRQLQRFGG
jgi:hypothetical protein